MTTEQNEQVILWDALEEAFPKNKKFTANLKEEIEQAEQNMIEIAYRDNNYNQSRTAKALNISRPLLIHKLKKYSLLKDSI